MRDGTPTGSRSTSFFIRGILGPDARSIFMRWSNTSTARTGLLSSTQSSAVTAVGFAWGKTQAADITQASADGALHRLGHRRVVYAAWIIEIGFHERQQFGAVIVGIRLIGDTAIVGIGDASAVVAAGAACERDRQHQDRRALCRYPQVQLVFRSFA